LALPLQNPPIGTTLTEPSDWQYQYRTLRLALPLQNPPISTALTEPSD
jgi:hypothetical protein